jgi:hypothetical protein
MLFYLEVDHPKPGVNLPGPPGNTVVPPASRRETV